MAGSAIPTTVASRAAIPEPSTVAVTTQRPAGVDSRRPGDPREPGVPGEPGDSAGPGGSVAGAATLTTFLPGQTRGWTDGTRQGPVRLKFIKEQNYPER